MTLMNLSLCRILFLPQWCHFHQTSFMTVVCRARELTRRSCDFRPFSLFDFSFPRDGFFQACHRVFTCQPCPPTIVGVAIWKSVKQSHQSPFLIGLTTKLQSTITTMEYESCFGLVVRIEREKKERLKFIGFL
ncbi:hypothetical protein VIGAN_04304500 [Vigna angularis var. angularis]|uniref:Secreted protein n=1 Tax=Vigna angularis var. angularis TaxID=157739 RepID=A0A0S3RY77_PHAAN|nr:hypothetical protein VIGAN_04304500 [Vigna angularis var. angularis]